MSEADIIYLGSMPVITALIGWLTNKAAIWMLFHPRMPVHIWPLRLHGLIPRRKTELARRTAEVIAKELLSDAHIEKQINEQDSGPMIEELAYKLVYQGLEPKLARIPLFGAAIARNSINGIHKAVLEEMRKEAPEFQRRLAARMAKRIDVRSIVEERINALETDRMESVIRSVASRELRGIELMGGVLGFLIGLAQAGTLLLIRRL